MEGPAGTHGTCFVMTPCLTQTLYLLCCLRHTTPTVTDLHSRDIPALLSIQICCHVRSSRLLRPAPRLLESPGQAASKRWLPSTVAAQPASRSRMPPAAADSHTCNARAVICRTLKHLLWSLQCPFYPHHIHTCNVYAKCLPLLLCTHLYTKCQSVGVLQLSFA